MSTVIRPELVKTNPLYISKHRYYELKHFCLQYPEWKEKCRYLRTSSLIKPGEVSRDDSWIVYKTNMDLIDKCLEQFEDWLRPFIFKAVTLGISYTTLKTLYNIPCCKETFYDAYRKFFYILDAERN